MWTTDAECLWNVSYTIFVGFITSSLTKITVKTSKVTYKLSFRCLLSWSVCLWVQLYLQKYQLLQLNFFLHNDSDFMRKTNHSLFPSTALKTTINQRAWLHDNLLNIHTIRIYRIRWSERGREGGRCKKLQPRYSHHPWPTRIFVFGLRSHYCERTSWYYRI